MSHMEQRGFSGRLLVLFVAVSSCVAGQQVSKLSQNPDGARLITTDVAAFWKVFDRASLKDAAELLQRDYIDSGTVGLHDFVESRIGNGRHLAATIAARPRYYAAIRASTLAVDQNPAIKEAIRASFHRLKEIYPAAVFPDVYFLIGAMNSAGTVSSNGLLIGVEMNARSEDTPLDELSNWERAVVGQIANLPNIVAHESIHIQQPREEERTTLLQQALREGGADFIGEMISGGIINRIQRTYGDAHGRALWEEFRKEMQGAEVGHWMYQGDKSKGRPADLGYYIGYKICETFYRRAADKRAAVSRILNITDAEAFLRESGYGGGN